MFTFLRNGFREAQVVKDGARLATYMRAEDTEFELFWVGKKVVTCPHGKTIYLLPIDSNVQVHPRGIKESSMSYLVPCNRSMVLMAGGMG